MGLGGLGEGEEGRDGTRWAGGGGEEGRDETRWAGGGGKKEGMGLGGLREGEKGGTGLGGLGEGSTLHQLYETNKAGTLNTEQLRTSEP